jgi:hypothetical protein
MTAAVTIAPDAGKCAGERISSGSRALDRRRRIPIRYGSIPLPSRP